MRRNILVIAVLLTSCAYTQTLGPSEGETSLQGSRLTYYPRPALAQCQTDCANNANCGGFTWINAGTYNRNDPAMCYLMSAVTGRTPARGHVSAVKGVSTLQPPAGTESGISLTGTTLTYYPRPSIAQCQADCVANGNCQGFTWIQPATYRPTDPAMCYLMSAVTGRSPAPGHISGVKQSQGPTTGSFNIGGSWQWHACNDEYGRLIGITMTNATNFTGAFENGDGLIKNGTLRGDRIEFDRESGSWKQHYSGQVVNSGGQLKIVNGVWTGEYLSSCPGRNNWRAEKR